MDIAVDNKPLTFVHFSDLHYCEGDSSDKLVNRFMDRTGLTPGEQIELSIRNILAATTGVDFFVISGDLIQKNSGAAEYAQVQQILSTELGDTPYFVALGNHDNDNFWVGFSDEKQGEGSYYYTHDFKGLRIIGLDSRGGDYETGRFEQAQLEWLASELATPAPRGTILTLHHTPHVSGEVEFLTYQCENPQDLLDVISGTDVRALFCGHTHKHFLSTFGTVPCYTVESVAFGIEFFDDNMVVDNYTGYNHCVLDGDSLQVEHVVIEPPNRIAETIYYSEF